MISSGERYEYIVAIGTSTGGPKALEELMKHLSSHLPASYVIVQHMPAGFTKSLAERLNRLSELEVKEAENAEILKKGTVYIAPGGKQLRVINGLVPQIEISEEVQYKSHRPSVNIMMTSLANLYPTRKVIGIIMTGMGNDGLEGVTQLKKNIHAKVIIEAESSCVVYGMPRAIANEKLQDYELPLDEIAQVLKRIMGD